MTNNANGFNLIGRTVMSVDDQIVYTSEVDLLTGEVVPKPMIGPSTQRRTWCQPNQPNYPRQLRDGKRPNRTGLRVWQHQRRRLLCHHLSAFDVMAGKAKVTVAYSAYDNNDAYRYENKTCKPSSMCSPTRRCKSQRFGPSSQALTSGWRQTVQDTLFVPQGVLPYRCLLGAIKRSSRRWQVSQHLP